MNKHIEDAMEIRNEQPMVCNCAQTILRVYAKELGLSEKVVIAAGAGDNAAAAVGTGTVGNGACNISLGTSGTVFISSEIKLKWAQCMRFLQGRLSLSSGYIYC